MKEKIKKHYKFILGIVVGLVLSSLVAYAATAVASSNVSYSNTASGLSSTTVQGAIDELNEKAKSHCPAGYRCTSLINKAYIYNQASEATNYCVTGEEDTCIETDCYQSTAVGSCEAGTIIKYQVNDSEEKYFYVLHDDGATLTIQQRERTVSGAWYSGYTINNGPTSLLAALDTATSEWTNVPNQTYTLGTTVFKDNAYTGCSKYNSCTYNSYTLSSRTGKARAITLQEAVAVGCTEDSKSCPIWMYNYMHDSISNGGTVNDGSTDSTFSQTKYYTLSAQTPYSYSSSSSSDVWTISQNGSVSTYMTNFPYYGTRAVVVVNK